MMPRESGQNRCLFDAAASLWHNKLTNLSASLSRFVGRWQDTGSIHLCPFRRCMWGSSFVMESVCVVHFAAANHVGLITSVQGCFIHASRNIRGKLQLLHPCHRPLSTKSWAAKWRVTGCRVSSLLSSALHKRVLVLASPSLSLYPCSGLYF